MASNNPTSPATVFLRMAAFNGVAAISFTLFYFLYRGAGGENSYLLLIAAGVGLLATVGSLFAYQYFKTKLASGKKE